MAGGEERICEFKTQIPVPTAILLRRGNLAEIEKATEGKGVYDFGEIRVYAVNYEATVAYPKKFLYRGCTRPTSGGRLCRKSVELYPCVHDPNGEEATNMFHFEMFFTDGSMGGRPMRATVFAAAAEAFLQMKVDAMKALNEAQQMQTVDWIVRTFLVCAVSFRVSKMSVQVQTLTRIIPPGAPVMVNPVQSFSRTPGSTTRTNDAGPSRNSRKKLATRAEQREASRKVIEAADILKLSFLDLTGSDDDE